jgi:hypothetical protein
MTRAVADSRSIKRKKQYLENPWPYVKNDTTSLVRWREYSMPTDRMFLEEHMDVLHNLEMSIVSAWKENPRTADTDVHDALRAHIRNYENELRGREPRSPRLGPLANEVYASLQPVCEFHLGRGDFRDENDEPVTIGDGAISVEELSACLKHIQRSVEKWTKAGGPRGYLTFVSQFVGNIGP